MCRSSLHFFRMQKSIPLLDLWHASKQFTATAQSKVQWRKPVISVHSIHSERQCNLFLIVIWVFFFPQTCKQAASLLKDNRPDKPMTQTHNFLWKIIYLLKMIKNQDVTSSLQGALFILFSYRCFSFRLYLQTRNDKIKHLVGCCETLENEEIIEYCLCPAHIKVVVRQENDTVSSIST